MKMKNDLKYHLGILIIKHPLLKKLKKALLPCRDGTDKDFVRQKLFSEKVMPE